VRKIAKLSWRFRGTGGGTCTAEVNEPIRGYRVKSSYRPPALGAPATDGEVPTVSWITFDGDVYWVRLAESRGWPRTIRVTKNDVDGVRS
jgi:hypothetical protein